MCDEMHPAQDTSAWLILLESSESQLYRGVSHFLMRKFCEKWKFAVWKELLKHFDVRYSSFTDIVRLENEPEKIDFSYANQLYWNWHRVKFFLTGQSKMSFNFHQWEGGRDEYTYRQKK